MVQIYLNDETKGDLMNIKKKDPNFNLSSFVQEHLMKQAGEKSAEELDFDFLNKKIEQAKAKKNMIELEIRSYEELLLKAKIKKSEIDKKGKETQQLEEKQQKERILNAFRSIKDLFYIEDKEKIRELAEEFVSRYFYEKTTPSLFEFMSSKGYKDKLALEQEPSEIPTKNEI